MQIIKRSFFSLFALLLAFALSLSALAAEYPCEGISNASSVKVRKKASTSGAIVTTLKKGEIVTVLEETTTKSGVVWYKIKTEKGKEGHVMGDYLSIPETELIEAAQNSPDAQLMNLSIRASCSNYNHVGDNWTQYYEWNGNQVKANEEIQGFIAPDIDLTVYSRIREQESSPDTSMEKTLYTPTAEDAANGFVITQEITVTENSGRYKGNQAHWTVTFTFSIADKTE